MLQASCKKQILKFKFPAGTSRGILYQKDSWFILLNNGKFTAAGECSIIPNLSIDDVPEYESKLNNVINDINLGTPIDKIDLKQFPSIAFGLEMAFLNLKNQQEGILFPSAFTQGMDGIPINGLIWMGTFDEMDRQIREKIDKGFTCIKLKIGAINFDDELELLRKIRLKYSPEVIQLRVDANGAFHIKDALHNLERLSKHQLHSIEQPIKQGQVKAMAELCVKTPLPIALDEELIGCSDDYSKQQLLTEIKPQYIILKPSLLGGFATSETWINIAEKNGIDWWITSALESNVGLNAIAQWTFQLHKKGHHGLGTGQIYTNNILSPLFIDGEFLRYDPNEQWKL